MQTGMWRHTTNSYRNPTIVIGKVLNLYPEANMVDVILLDGTIIQQVQIMSQSSSRTGRVELPVPEYETPLTEDAEKIGFPCLSTENDVFVVVGFVENSLNRPIVLGFLFPEENEVLCSRKQDGNSDGSMFMWKHKSNVYTRVDEAGDIEISHPSGVLIKIGKNAERTEIYNYDRKVRPFKYKQGQSDELAPAPWMTIQHPSGNYYTIDPDGNVFEEIVGNVERTIKGNLTENIGGDINRTVDGEVSETVTGKINRESKDSILDKTPRIDHNE